MNKSIFTLVSVLILLVVTGLPMTSAAGEGGSALFPIVSLGLGIDYVTGDYGSETRTDFVSIPLYFDYYPNERLDFELIVPLVYQSNQTGDLATLPYRTPRGSTVLMAAAGPGGGTSRTFTDSDSSANGLGDMTLTAGLVLLTEKERHPQLRASLYLKAPTADEEKGLGTGEWDWGPGLGVSKWLGNWHLFAEGRYVFQGDSDLYATRNYLSYNGGLGRQFTPAFYGALQARGATESAEGVSDYLEGRAKFIWRFLPDNALEGYLGRGITDASPDFSAGLALFHDF